MATLVFNSHYSDLYSGRINVNTGVFKALFTTSSYVPSKDGHSTRANITNEITGTNYPAGGVIVTATLGQDMPTDKTTLTFAAFSIANLTASGIRQVVYYLSNGGPASGDYLVCVVDFESNHSPANQTFYVSATTTNIINPN